MELNKVQPRILVLFGNLPLWGQERANIETLDLLRKRGADVMFLIRDEYTQGGIQSELARKGLKYSFVSYYGAVRYRVNLRVWIFNVYSIFWGSLQLLGWLRRFHASHIHVGSTAWVLNFIPALLLSRIP